MKDKEMIEKMAKTMADCDITCEECFEQLERVMTLKIEDRANHCQAYMYAKRLYEQGGQIIPEDSVVLTKEEQEVKVDAFVETLNAVKLQERKATAEKMLREIYSTSVKHIKGKELSECFIELSFEQFDKLAKQFGVDLGE